MTASELIHRDLEMTRLRMLGRRTAVSQVSKRLEQWLTPGGTGTIVDARCQAHMVQVKFDDGRLEWAATTRCELL